MNVLGDNRDEHQSCDDTSGTVPEYEQRLSGGESVGQNSRNRPEKQIRKIAESDIRGEVPWGGVGSIRILCYGQKNRRELRDPIPELADRLCPEILPEIS